MLDFLADYLTINGVPGMNALALVVVCQSPEDQYYDLEVRVYLDGWVELYMGGHCFKSYHHGATAT